MKCLGIDTTTEICSVALFDGERYFQESTDRTSDPAIRRHSPGHSQVILDMVSGILDSHDLALNDLDAIVTDTGPGSFTGVRIGLGVAQGIAYGAGLPLIGVSSLEALAMSVSQPGAIVIPAIDARMKQIYCGKYETREDGRPLELIPPKVISPQDLGYDLKDSDIGVGSGWDVYSQDILANQDHPPKIETGKFPEAIYALQIAQYIKFDNAVSPQYLEASYVRNNVVN